LKENKNCHGSYRLSFVDNSTHQPYQKTSNNYKNVVAEFELTSRDCNISLYSEVSTMSAEMKEQALYYAAMMTIVCATHIYACIRMARIVVNNEIQGFRTSIMSLGFLIGWDMFLCIYHLEEALTSNDYFQYFIVPTFAYFLLVSVFETRLILLVWKATYYGQYRTFQEVRRGILKFYTRFYGFQVLFIFLCAFCLPMNWFFYSTALFFIPQIVHNALRSQRYKFDFVYIFFLGISRILPSFYLKLCPENIYKLTPDPSFTYYYAGIISFQIIILVFQSILGSRFFIPSFFLPPKYNYYLKVNTDQSTDEAENCPICMDPLNRNPTTLKSSLVEKNLPKYITNMLTPCKHQFHEKCLKEWMDLKLECPFCRTKLPAIG